MLKRLHIVIIATLILAISGCTNDSLTFNSDAERFKYEYESVNNKYDDYGQKSRIVSVGDDNPMVYASFVDIIEKIENGETFAIYFGYAKCPWCRGALEAMLVCARTSSVDVIYYVDVYDSRDTYELKDGDAVKTSEGSAGYAELLDVLSPVLDDYVLQDEDGALITVGEKRIYAPNVIVVKDGVAVGAASDSALFTDPYGDISDELYSDMIAIYSEVFSLLAS